MDLKGQGRTFLDLGLLHLVVEGLLQVELVAVGELVEVDLEALLVHDPLPLMSGREVLFWLELISLLALYGVVAFGFGED